MYAQQIGQRLHRAGLISEQQLAQALDIQQRKGGRLGSILIGMGAVTEQDLLQFLSHQYGLSILEDLPQERDEYLADLVPVETAKAHLILPVEMLGAELTVAMADPSNVPVIDELFFQTGCRVVPVVATESQIARGIRMLYGEMLDLSTPVSSPAPAMGSKESEGRAQLLVETPNSSEVVPQETKPVLHTQNLERLLQAATASLSVVEQNRGIESPLEQEAPIVQLVNQILMEAVARGASDVHVEPGATTVRVRYRIDGLLHPIMTVPIQLRNAMISRIKILAHLDIAERRLPQDGRMKFQQADRADIDVRVSILPGLHGEKVVMRLLNQASLQWDMTKLGMEEKELSAVREALSMPYGMMLVTGPTGSGKTTTLYSALQVLNTPHVNIVTAEDPVEYNISGIHQVHIKEEIGLGFAAALRSFLRQDPDVMMVGEIRDQETAQMAVKAALTGHRVLSTVHTNDAIRTISRLVDMGVEPFMVASAVTLIMAQRLVRQICRFCREAYSVPHEQLLALGFREEEARSLVPMRGRGCPACHHTGYGGRVALFEVLTLTDAVQQKILRQASPQELRATAEQAGFRSLRQNGLKKIYAGVTTIDEVVAATENYSRSSVSSLEVAGSSVK